VLKNLAKLHKKKTPNKGREKETNSIETLMLDDRVISNIILNLGPSLTL
jgi:hypothetical protein